MEKRHARVIRGYAREIQRQRDLVESYTEYDEVLDKDAGPRLNSAERDEIDRAVRVLDHAVDLLAQSLCKADD